jgi:TetR/AcrR family transcriptional regulator, cholesterol catabolism regulator
MVDQPAGRSPKYNRGERKPREERWAELLDVAATVFYEKGYQASSLNEIAARMNILKGSLYYYISSKDELLYEVVRSVHTAGMDNVRSIAAGPQDVLTRLENVIVAHIDHGYRNQPKVALMHEVHVLPANLRRLIAREYDSYESIFRELIIEAQEGNSIRPEIDPALAVLALLGSINSIFRWQRNNPDFAPLTVVRHIADVTVRGLATPQGMRRKRPTAVCTAPAALPPDEATA